MNYDNVHDKDFKLTADFGLTPMERAIADLYRGGDSKGQSRFTGNKKRCYMAFHPRANENTAKKRASELFLKPHMIQYLADRADQITKAVDFTAVDVLQESLEHLQVCKGLTPRVASVVVKGEVNHIDLKEYDVTGVKNAIDLIGRNIHVSAFKDEGSNINAQMGVVLMPATLSPDEWKETFSQDEKIIDSGKKNGSE